MLHADYGGDEQHALEGGHEGDVEEGYNEGYHVAEGEGYEDAGYVAAEGGELDGARRAAGPETPLPFYLWRLSHMGT